MVDDSEFVDGSAPALAALTIEELRLDPGTRAVGLSNTEDHLSAGIVTNGPSAGGETVWFLERADRVGPRGSPRLSCTTFKRCTTLSKEEGTVEVWLSENTLMLSHVDRTTGVIRSLEYHSTGTLADLARLRLPDRPSSLEQLTDLVTDARFGLETTPELAGSEIPGREVSPVGGFSPTARELTVSGDVRAIIQRHLGSGASVEEVWDGHGVDLTVGFDEWPAVEALIHLEQGDVGATCVGVDSCVTWRVDGADVSLAWDGGEDTAFDLLLPDDDEYHALVWSDGSPPGGDPREADLPVTVDQLVALLDDLDLEEK